MMLLRKEKNEKEDEEESESEDFDSDYYHHNPCAPQHLAGGMREVDERKRDDYRRLRRWSESGGRALTGGERELNGAMRKDISWRRGERDRRIRGGTM